MSLRDWPIGGAVVALILAGAMGFAAWQSMPRAVPPEPPALPPPPKLVVNREQAFRDFRVLSLGLPTVQTYPQPIPKAQK